ncbi:unnamed protein product [Arctogadus glacialis]
MSEPIWRSATEEPLLSPEPPVKEPVLPSGLPTTGRARERRQSGRGPSRLQNTEFISSPAPCKRTPDAEEPRL